METKEKALKPVDVIIAEEIVKDENNKETQTIKRTLTFPLLDVKSNVALRIFDKDNMQQFYCSTRQNTLVKKDAGFELDVTSIADKLVGCSYTLVPQTGTKQIIMQGKITSKKASANVVGITSRTGTEN